MGIKYFVNMDFHLNLYYRNHKKKKFTDIARIYNLQNQQLIDNVKYMPLKKCLKRNIRKIKEI